MNINDFLKTFLKSNHVLLALGETYHGAHESVMAEVIKHLAGFSGIFLEKPVSQQSDISEYLDSGVVNERLEKHFENAAKEGKNIRGTLLTILDSARLNKLPVFCVDSSKMKTDEYTNESNIGRYFLKGSSRDEDMFENIQKKISQNKKYLFFGGFQHLTSGTHFRSGEATLGSRLRKQYGNDFFNVVIYQLKDDDKNIIEDDIVAIDLRKPEDDNVILDNFIRKSGITTNEPNGSLKFDGYILHK